MEETEVGVQNINYLIRHNSRKSRLDWAIKISAVFDSRLWQFIFVFSILFNVVSTSFQYTFERKPNVSKDRLIVNIIYLLNLVMYILLLWRKDIHIYMKDPPKSKLLLIASLILLTPYSYIYDLAATNWSLKVAVRLNYITFFRLLHVCLYFYKKSNNAGMSYWIHFFVDYFVVIILIQHTIACCWYSLAFNRDYANNEISWLNTTTFNTTLLTTVYEWYVFCYYYAVTSTANSSFGDIKSETNREMLFSIFAMCVGFFITTGLLIGSIQSRLINSDFRRNSMLKIQMSDIRKYLKENIVDQDIQNSIKSYYKILWKNKNGVSDAREALLMLPFPLRSEICYDINICPLLCSITFRDKPESFLRAIANIMKHEFYQPDEMIYLRNVIKSKMIYVVVGAIQILSDEDDESPIITFGPGTCLGESSLTFAHPSKACVQTACYTELQVLDRRHFLRIIDLFPQFYSNIRESIHERVAEYQSLKKQSPPMTVKMNLFKYKGGKKSVIQTLKDKLRGKIPQNAPMDKYISMYRLQDDAFRKKLQGLKFSRRVFMLNPDSLLTQIWEVIVIIVTAFIAIVYPYAIAFNRGFSQTLEFSSYFLELILIIDVVVILFTGIDKKNKRLFTFNHVMREQVQRCGFYLDLISAIPFEHFADPNHPRYYYLFKLNRLLKSYRVCKLFNRLENNLNSPVLLIRLIKYPIYIICSSYWLGNLLYLVTCYEPICNEYGWFFKKLKQEVESHMSEALTSHEAFLSVYFAVSLFCSTAFGDIVAADVTDLIIVSLGIMAGIFIFAYCTAELGATITNNLHEKIKFQENLFSVKNFLEEKNINLNTKKKVIEFFELQWYYDKGRSLEKKPLFHNASKTIQEVLLEHNKIELLLRISIFKDMSVDFLQVLSMAMESIVLPPNQVLCNMGEPIKAIFIIQQGYCIRYHDHHEYLMGPCSHFGLVPGILNLKSAATIRSLTHVKLIRIPERLFWKSLTIFPGINKIIQMVRETFNTSKEFERFKEEERTDKEEYPFRKWTNISLKGSIVNVVRYCKINSESYTEPFKNKFGILYFIKYFIPPICLLPSGTVLKVWVTFRFVSTVILAYLLPYQQIARSYFTLVNKVIFGLDIVAYIDLAVMFFVGYYGQKKQLIIHPVKTIFHYMKGKFILDLIFCFPFELLGKESYYLGLIKLGQLYRIPQYFEYFKGDIKMKLYYVEICKFLMLSSITAEIWACIMVITTCIYYDPADEDTAAYIRHSVKLGLFLDNETTPHTMYCEKDSWLDKSKYRHLNTPYELFILSLYFCTSALTTCGFGDVAVEYRENMAFIIIMMVAGILFFGYMYASVSSHKVDCNSLLSKNQELVHELKRYMDRENVCKDTQAQVIDHLEYVWKRTGGAVPNEILQNLHSTLHEDVVLETYGGILRNVPLFENVNESFLRAIGKELKERYFHRQEILLRAEDVANEVYIIYRGKVRISSMLHDVELYMGPGAIFGNLKSKIRSQISVTITALNNVDCLYINTSVIYDILKKHPNISEEIKNKLQSSSDYLVNPKSSQENDPELKLIKNRTLSRLSTITRTTGSLSMESLDGNKYNIIMNFFLLCVPWKWCNVVINPNSLLFQVSDGLAVIMSLISYGSVTFQFVFQSHSNVLMLILIITDIFFFIKLFYDIHRTYEDNFGELIKSNRKVLKRFFSKNKILRFFQVLTSLPIPYLALLAGFYTINAYFYFSVMRLIYLFRFLYIYLYYEERRNKLLTDRLLLEISIIVMSTAIVIHTSACFWYFIACPFDHCIKDSWADKLDQQNMTEWSIYLRCLYYNVEIITTTGTGDMEPDTSMTQLCYIVVVMLLINCIIGIFIGEVVNAVGTYTATLCNYEYEVENLRCFLRNEHLSNFQMSKMLKYVLQLWTISNGRQMPRLLPELPRSIRCDLMFEIYGHHLKESYIFKGAELSFLKQLSGHFKHTILFPNNYIVQHGDSDKSMYFIHSGEVEILTVHPNLMETIHEILFQGDMFGLIQGLFHGIPHHFAFRARTTVHIVSLCLNDWEDLLNFFPESKNLIYDRARTHYTNF